MRGVEMHRQRSPIRLPLLLRSFFSRRRLLFSADSADGARESEQSWRDVLATWSVTGSTCSPTLAVADGAFLGFWKAMAKESCPKPASTAAGAQDRERDQQVAQEPQPGPKGVPRDLDGRHQPPPRPSMPSWKTTRPIPEGGRLPGKDRDMLLAFYDFPAEHWNHLRTTNPIESTFATVRHRAFRSNGVPSPSRTTLAIVFKLLKGRTEELACVRPNPPFTSVAAHIS